MRKGGCLARTQKKSNNHGPNPARFTLKAREALVLGILLLLAGAFLFGFSGVVVTVYTVTSDSYWTYYEFQHNTHHEYQCVGLGVSPLCTFYYYFAYGGAAALSFAGAIMVAVSLYRLIEAPHVDSLVRTHSFSPTPARPVEESSEKHLSHRN